MSIESITGTDPAKSYRHTCVKKPTKADQICDLLEEILGCFKDIKIGDVTLNVDLTEVKACLADMLECLKEQKISLQELCTKVEKLESLLVENNLLLGEIKNCITKMHEEILACLVEIKASSAEIVACLKELKLSDAEILKCLESLKLTAEEILECFKEIKSHFEECCIVEGQLTEPARCQSFNRPDPFGNEKSDYAVGIGGNFVDLPNPYSHADVIAALNSLCGNWQIVVNSDDPTRSTLCNTDLDCPAATFRSCSRNDGDVFPPILACSLSTSLAIIVQPEETCNTYLRVWTKYEKPIADNIQNIDSTLMQLLDKTCESQIACLKCASFTIDPETVIANVITGVQDSSGSVQMLPQPANGAIGFADQVSQLGFSVDSVVGNVVTVCGSKLIYSYQLEDGTIVPADGFFDKKGQLVCDPAATAQLELNNQLLNQNNQLLSELINCLCGSCDTNEDCTAVVSVTSENNPEGWSWVTGPTANTAVTYPTPIGTEEPQDMQATASVDCAELEKCLPACASSENVRLRFTFSHQQLGPGHSGFIFVVQGGQAVAVSGNNTTALTPSGLQNQQIGTAIGDPDDAGYVDRWVEYLVPKSDLCSVGVLLATGGFQGFDNSGVFDESLSVAPTITIIGCE